VVNCGFSTDTVCLPCGTCDYGYYLASACTYDSPPLCVSCPTSCPDGYYFDATVDCAGTHANPCTPC
jgi:hypothetical protein